MNAESVPVKSAKEQAMFWLLENGTDNSIQSEIIQNASIIAKSISMIKRREKVAVNGPNQSFRTPWDGGDMSCITLTVLILYKSNLPTKAN